jgi:hypothetical protein
MNYIYKVFPRTALNLTKLSLSKTILIDAHSTSRSALVVRRPLQNIPEEDLTEERPEIMVYPILNLDFGGTLFCETMKIVLWLEEPSETTTFDLIGFESVETYNSTDFLINYTYVYTAMNLVEDGFTFKVVPINTNNYSTMSTAKTILPLVDLENRTDIVLQLSEGNVIFGLSDTIGNVYGLGLFWALWLKEDEIPTFDSIGFTEVQSFQNLFDLSLFYLNI